MEGFIPKRNRKNGTVALIVGGTGLVLTVATLWFNRIAGGYEYYLVGNGLLLFFIPMLVIFLVGEDASDFGFGTGQSKNVRWITPALFVGLLFILVPASRQTGFQDYYPMFRRFTSFMGGGRYVDGGVLALAYGWLSYGMYMFFWEFFFRGYLLFGLSRSIKWWAIIVQAIPFFILHCDKPALEFAASLPAGIILGALAWRSKSFLPCFALHWAATVAFDVLVMMGKR